MDLSSRYYANISSSHQTVLHFQPRKCTNKIKITLTSLSLQEYAQRSAKTVESAFKKTVANVQEDIMGTDVNIVSYFLQYSKQINQT